MNKLPIICITPVRNEAWILDIFLKATSLWADYIIIADQNSTDGSREIALKYSKVKLIDNFSKEMHQAQSRRLLFDEVDKIKENKIVFALDADEFLSGDFLNTQDWKDIINSKPDSCFWFEWMNVSPNRKTYSTSNHYYWACHVKGFLNGKFPDNHIHEWRLPWPKDVSKENVRHFNQIQLIHFGRTNLLRQNNKEKFYQVSTLVKEPKFNVISLFRTYHNSNLAYDQNTLTYSIFHYYDKNKIHLLNEINFTDEGNYYLTEINKYFGVLGLRFFSYLDIWDQDFCSKLNIKDPRNNLVKLLHYYLRLSQPTHSFIGFRILDYVLKNLSKI